MLEPTTLYVTILRSEYDRLLEENNSLKQMLTLATCSDEENTPKRSSKRVNKK